MIAYEAAAMEDGAALAPLMARAFDPAFGEAWSAEQVNATLALSGGLAEVARANGCIVGFALLRCVTDEAELLLVAVDPSWRGRGIARHLIARAFDAVRERGVRGVFLEVRECNASARSLYKAHGFNTVGRRRAYYAGIDNRRYDAITMRRNL